MKTSFLILGALILSITIASAQSIPPFPGIRFQATLSDKGGNFVNGTHPVTLRIYKDSSGGLPIYTQLYSAQINNGILDVMINLNHLPFDCLYWVETQLDNEVFAPRTQLGSVPYSFHALRADTASFSRTIADSSVNSSKIQKGAIQFVNIAQSGAGLGQVEGIE